MASLKKKQRSPYWWIKYRDAAEEMGMDLHGSGYSREWQGSPGYDGYGGQPERQEWSDDTLRRCRDRLIYLANTTGEPVRHEMFEAVQLSTFTSASAEASISVICIQSEIVLDRTPA